MASMYTFGAPVPGAFMPDLERAGCILYWGYNPSVSRLVHATATVDATGLTEADLMVPAVIVLALTVRGVRSTLRTRDH